jgi:hypothetical protein
MKWNTWFGYQLSPTDQIFWSPPRIASATGAVPSAPALKFRSASE